MKQDESQGCLRPSYVLGPALWPVSGEGGCSKEGGGAKEIKSQTRTVLVIINTVYSISYNPYFQKK